MECRRCGCNSGSARGVKATQSWGRYANGRLHVLCPACDETAGREHPEGKKRCGRCREVKEMELFDRVSTSADGRHCWCRGCRAAERKNKAAQDGRELITTQQRMMRAADGIATRKRARTLRRIEQAWLAVGEKETRGQYLERARKRHREYYRHNTEKERARATHYKHANPSKAARWGEKRKELAAMQSDGTLSRDTIGRLFASAAKCPYCGCKLSARNKSLDHMVPLSNGGVHGLSNVLICCRTCNLTKQAMPYLNWLERLGGRQRAIAERAYCKQHGAPPEQAALPLRWAC